MIVTRIIPTLMLTVALIPASVVAQTPEERIQSTLDRASEAGIPTSLLESKIREGEAKGIVMDRIADAVQYRLDGLARAQEALADIPDAGPADLDVGADALESGVSEAVLAELAEGAPGESRTAAIAALSHLVGEDIVPQEALDQVQSALARGPDALENLPGQARVPAGVGALDGPAEVPTEMGPPQGVPAPGETPAGTRPGGAEPPSVLPGSGGAPSNVPGFGGV